jgi:glycosyltransferase involved in cell wall biosynthesis
MKIGIDAKWYFSGPPSGRVVVKNLIDCLVKSNSLSTFCLFVKKNEMHLFQNQDNFRSSKSTIELIPVINIPNFISNLIILPFLCSKNNIDKMIFQNYTPFFNLKKTKYITIILDFLFLDYPEFFSFREILVFRLMKTFSYNADQIITISNSEKQRIIRHTKIDQSKISVIYLGVDKEFKPQSSKNKQSIIQKFQLPSVYILYIGRLNIRKNIPTLIKAMPHLKSNVNLVLIGSKDLNSFDIDSTITSLNIQNRVRQLGFVNQTDMIQILSSATIFCYPSFAEGFGLPPLEAMASGTPVVTTNNTSIPEVCNDAVIYFNPNDEIDLANKLDMVLMSEELRALLVMKGLKRASLFSWEKASEELLSIVQN